MHVTSTDESACWAALPVAPHFAPYAGLQQSALQEVGELPLHAVRQRSAFRCQLYQKFGEVFIDNLMEKCLFGPVALMPE